MDCRWKDTERYLKSVSKPSDCASLSRLFDDFSSYNYAFSFAFAALYGITPLGFMEHFLSTGREGLDGNASDLILSWDLGTTENFNKPKRNEALLHKTPNEIQLLGHRHKRQLDRPIT